MIVEVPISASALAGTMANMRSWLDTNHCTPIRFEMKSDKPRAILIRVEFKDSVEGEGFRRAFDGRDASENSGIAAA